MQGRVGQRHSTHAHHGAYLELWRGGGCGIVFAAVVEAALG